MKKRALALAALAAITFCSFKIISLGHIPESANGKTQPAADAFSPWPAQTKEMHPWTRWWWMGSAVDEINLGKVLTSYSNAGFGGVEITPIYGAVGFEKRYIPFLSPQWMNMLNYTVNKANSLDMGVDMNNGTGWPFGGPQVSNEDAASKLIIQTYSLEAGNGSQLKIVLKDERQIKAGAQLQALTAYGPNSEVVSLFNKVAADGQLNWTPPSGTWQLYAAFCGKTLQMVKRAAPGGEGLVMDHLDKKAVDDYLHRFDVAFNGQTPGVRAFFNDSYEVYNANWSPLIFDQFQKRRGYDLRLYLKQLQSNDSTDMVMRVKSDYRETISDMLVDNLAVNWTNWAHKNKAITKYQAHGSPGNLLDLYGAADIPECEAYFGLSYFPIPGLRHDTTDVVNPNSNPNVFKFASSAAHIYGKPLASSETFVWLTDHFKTSWSQCKPEVERLFLGGINHVFYHGTTYSPEDVPFPGWQFYAAANFTPSNSLWPQLSGLNDYITRCQSVLQAGKPDNELMVYWPVYDCWSSPRGTDMQISMHNTNEWLNQSAFNKTVTLLQQRGYALDYVSDKMLRDAKVVNGSIQVSATSYKSLIVPSCKVMPAATLEKIMLLVKDGATIIFQDPPHDVPGLTDVAGNRKTVTKIISSFPRNNGTDEATALRIGSGSIYVSAAIVPVLKKMGINGEELTARGLKFIRRETTDGKYYYLVNHTASAIDASIPLNVSAKTVVMMDPQSTDYGIVPSSMENGKTSVRIQMQPGEALVLKCYTSGSAAVLPKWKYLDKPGTPMLLRNVWTLHFTAGGPEMPSDQQLPALVSWTQLPDSKAISFSGTGEYTSSFTLPAKPAGEYILDLGRVCESAHVWINGQDGGILWSIPFRTRIGKYVHPGNNTIKIEVVNLMANRIRDMDIRGIKWRNYHEINFVNINYMPFDASKWMPQPSGLLGPVVIY